MFKKKKINEIIEDINQILRGEPRQSNGANMNDHDQHVKRALGNIPSEKPTESSRPFYINFDPVHGDNKNMQCALAENVGVIIFVEDVEGSTLAKYQHDNIIHIDDEIERGPKKFCLASKLLEEVEKSSEKMHSAILKSFNLHFTSSSPSISPSFNPSFEPSQNP